MTDLTTEPDLTTQTVELLRELIRNACVTDGSADSGGEERSAATLQRFFAGSGLSVEPVEPHPGRVSLVAELPGTDPAAPSLLLLGHTDVVPAGRGWAHDPFGGELVEREGGAWVWGRGALDMLHLTAAYAVVMRRFATANERMPGRLVFAAVADEESGGHLGAEWIVANRPELVDVDGVLSETGGIPLAVRGVVRGVTVTVGEKGMAGRRLRFAGHPRHASTPFGADNAIVTAAAAVTRIAQHAGHAQLDDLWPQYVAALDVPDEVRAALTDPALIDAALPQLGPIAGLAHAVTHTTFSPDLVRGGDKLNVVAQNAHVDLDIRTLPGVSGVDVDAQLRAALGPLAERTVIEPLGGQNPASRSPLDTPLYAALDEAVAAAYPGARAVPVIAPGAADSRYFRTRGIPAYGFGMFSPRWRHADFRHLVHSVDERIDVESVGLAVHAIERVVRRVLG
ncbi:M20/M25/M40 family metallo-hydrolase [Gryllotalpicola koreensis]|uniref:M20/M25/M40 family metallo-hydrolase n=1 Tax=Gryllotalpicola koreensis TaxID=993086 RepID=A0ABP7ZUN2_9MICO